MDDLIRDDQRLCFHRDLPCSALCRAYELDTGDCTLLVSIESLSLSAAALIQTLITPKQEKQDVE